MKNYSIITIFLVLIFAAAVQSSGLENKKEIGLSGSYAAIHAGDDHRGALISIYYQDRLSRNFKFALRYSSVLSNEDPYSPIEGQTEAVHFVYPHRYFQAGQMTLDILLVYPVIKVQSASVEIYGGGSIGYYSLTHHLKSKTFYNEEGRKEGVNFFKQHSGLVNGAVYGITVNMNLEKTIAGIYAEALQYHPGMEINAFGRRLGRRF